MTLMTLSNIWNQNKLAMTKTQLFIRFLKNENIYTIVMRYLNSITFIYDGVYEEIIAIKNIERILFASGVKNYMNIMYRWDELSKNTTVECKTPTYNNIATPLLQKFIEQNNLEKEVINVLYAQGNIQHKKLNPSSIDKLLRKHKTVLYEFFMDCSTFCNWNDYEYLLNTKNIEWNDIDNKWRHFLNINKIPNKYV